MRHLDEQFLISMGTRYPTRSWNGKDQYISGVFINTVQNYSSAEDLAADRAKVGGATLLYLAFDFALK